MICLSRRALPGAQLLFSLALFVLWPALARADLGSDVKAVLGDRLLNKTRVGIEVVQLGDTAQGSRVVLRHEAELPLIPASNLKLITTSAALDYLGADFKFHTLLVKHGNDLILVGDGDPTLGDAEFLRRVGWDVTTVFNNWAEGLKKRGITSVENVLVDDSVFDENFLHSHWPIDQAHKRYAAQVAAVNLNANCLDFTVQPTGGLVAFSTNPPTHYLNVRNTCQSGGANAIWLSRTLGTNNVILSGTCPAPNEVSVTVHDPALFAATVLAETLSSTGIKVNGKVGRDRTVRAALCSDASAADATWSLVAVHETPLTQVIAQANKYSINLYAEALCKRLGFAVSGQSGSWANGTAAVGAFLTKAGVDEREYHLDDGCGLSKENRIAAHAIVSVLQFNYFGPNKPAFFGSLSVAGSDGTLEKRFEGSDLRGRVFGKSGFVNSVSALSGYLHARDGRWYAFSILMNGIPAGSNSSIKPLQEAMVRAVDAQAAR